MKPHTHGKTPYLVWIKRIERLHSAATLDKYVKSSYLSLRFAERSQSDHGGDRGSPSSAACLGEGQAGAGPGRGTDGESGAGRAAAPFCSSGCCDSGLPCLSGGEV